METVFRSNVNLDKQTPTVVLFGSTTDRIEELMHLLSTVGEVSFFGISNESDGIEKIKELGISTDLILIDGNYSDEARMRIKNLATYLHPGVEVSEPGHKYPHSDVEILDDVWTKLERLMALETN